MDGQYVVRDAVRDGAPLIWCRTCSEISVEIEALSRTKEEYLREGQELEDRSEKKGVGKSQNGFVMADF